MPHQIVDMFDGAGHPDPYVPPAAPPASAGKSVGIKVQLDPKGHVRRAVVSQSSGSELLDEAARSWAQYEWLYVPSATARTEYHLLHFSREASNERENVRVARSIIPETPRPPYPYLARRLRKEGVVDLLLRLRGDGSVREAKVTRSTGFSLLDLIAQQWAIRYWRLSEFSRRDLRCRVVFTLKGIPF
jgi:TonB family protein